jgi:hypothetical protein
VGGHPKNIIMLCCDAFGVLPPVAKLTKEQVRVWVGGAGWVGGWRRWVIWRPGVGTGGASLSEHGRQGGVLPSFEVACHPLLTDSKLHSPEMLLRTAWMYCLPVPQAMYYFISGYTAKVAGTEQGVTEPEATFSACFGSAFLMWHPVSGREGGKWGEGRESKHAGGLRKRELRSAPHRSPPAPPPCFCLLAYPLPLPSSCPCPPAPADQVCLNAG